MDQVDCVMLILWKEIGGQGPGQLGTETGKTVTWRARWRTMNSFEAYMSEIVRFSAALRRMVDS